MNRPAKQLVSWLDELARITDEPGALTRTFLSPAMRRANARVADWMRGVGLAVREDTMGNLIGRLEGARPRAKTLLLGSHLDTVRDAGRFDGALGVLLPIVALGEMRRRRLPQLPFAVEVIGFSEEEGVRFASAYLGSKGYAGQLRAADLRRRDAEGVTLDSVLADFNKRRFVLPRAAHHPRELLGYLEVHIEQGPVLENQSTALGVVTAIAGQTRGRLIFRGKAGHAGTTPMKLRQDAFAGAAEFVLFTEEFARRRAPLLATVGTIAVKPGAPNVIPGEAAISLDVRHSRDTTRRSALRQLLQKAHAIARERGLRCEWTLTQDSEAVTCSRSLSALLAESIRAIQRRSIPLVSGAGHDGVIISRVAPVAMMFVRCRDGLSHHPDENASPADLDVALRATIDFLERLGRSSVGAFSNAARPERGGGIRVMA